MRTALGHRTNLLMTKRTWGWEGRVRDDSVGRTGKMSTLAAARIMLTAGMVSHASHSRGKGGDREVQRLDAPVPALSLKKQRPAG